MHTYHSHVLCEQLASACYFHSSFLVVRTVREKKKKDVQLKRITDVWIVNKKNEALGSYEIVLSVTPDVYLHGIHAPASVYE